MIGRTWWICIGGARKEDRVKGVEVEVEGLFLWAG